ncbi:MAG TPA: hypothetical protein P5291_08670, partial [Flavobacteriales bacterium]|nr:hypothetical protein [Flavobacteriales bacterium]
PSVVTTANGPGRTDDRTRSVRSNSMLHQGARAGNGAGACHTAVIPHDDTGAKWEVYHPRA